MWAEPSTNVRRRTAAASRPHPEGSDSLHASAGIRHNVRVGPRFIAVLVVLAAGCGATLDDAPTDASSSDSFRSLDAAIDAPPIDARLCAGGDARATDASGSCFVYFIGPATYANAEIACTAFGSRLAVIKNVATNGTVRSLIGLTDAWVGGTDSAAEGSFIWLRNPLDPITVGTTYTNWRQGEPNNSSSNPEGEDCMIIEGDQNGTWDDRTCTDPGAGSYSYVCQF